MHKSLPELASISGHLFSLPYEAFKWELLKTAIRLEVFDHTSAPTSAESLADDLNLHHRSTEYILNALVALECLTKKDGKYQNTEQTTQLLTTGKETSLGACLLYLEKWTIPLLNGGLEEIVKKGPPPPQDIAAPEVWADAARASLNHSRCGRAQLIARHVSELPE